MLSKALYSVDFHRTSNLLATGGEDAVLRIWDLKKKKVTITKKSHAFPLTCVRFSPDEDRYVSANADGLIYLYSLKNSKSVSKLVPDEEGVSRTAVDMINSVQFCPLYGQQLASCSDRGKIHVWDIHRAKQILSISAHDAPCPAVVYSRHNPILLCSVGLDKRLILHDLRTKNRVASIQLSDPGTAVDWASDGSSIVVGTLVGSMSVFFPSNPGRPIYSMRTDEKGKKDGVQHKIQCIRFQREAFNSTATPEHRHKKKELYFSSKYWQREVDETAKIASISDTDDCDEGIKRVPLDTILEQKRISMTSTSIDLFSPLRNEQEKDYRESSEMKIEPAFLSPISVLGDSLSPAGNTASRKDEGNPLSVAKEANSSSVSVDFGHGNQFSSLQSIKTVEQEGSSSSRQSSNSSKKKGSPSSSTRPVYSSASPDNLRPHLSKKESAKKSRNESEKRSQIAKHTASIENERPNVFGDERIDIQQLTSHWKEEIYELEMNLEKQIRDLHVEIIRQFEIQKDELSAMMNEYSINKELMEEVRRLREENRRLKQSY